MAVAGLTHSLAGELAPTGSWVNAKSSPGLMLTDHDRDERRPGHQGAGQGKQFLQGRRKEGPMLIAMMYITLATGEFSSRVNLASDRRHGSRDMRISKSPPQT